MKYFVSYSVIASYSKLLVLPAARLGYRAVEHPIFLEVEITTTHKNKNKKRLPSWIN